MVKTINVKKGFAIDIFYILVIAVVVSAVVIVFWMSQTGALNKMAAAIASFLSFNLP